MTLQPQSIGGGVEMLSQSIVAERVGFVPGMTSEASQPVPETHPLQPTLPEARLAERVGFEPLPTIESKQLKRFGLPHDPPDPHESPGGDTY